MSELYDRYRLYFMLERKNERNNQFQHTSHPLSDGVLTAACPCIILVDIIMLMCKFVYI